MRLIDADEFKAFNARWMANEKDPDKKRARETRTQLFNTFIDMQETVDAVPVVRCKDCKWAEDALTCGCLYCNHPDGRNTIFALPEDFCNCGERKEIIK